MNTHNFPIDIIKSKLILLGARVLSEFAKTIRLAGSAAARQEK